MLNDLNNARDKVLEFIKEAGKKALNNWGNLDLEKHSDGVDVTTNTDKEIEKDFSDFVIKNFPGVGFKGEEFPELNREGEYVWHIDPIDGTKFYAANIPLWGVTICLTRFDEPVIGFVYNPVSNQLYHAVKDHGAFLNNKSIFVSQEKDIKKIQISLDIALNSNEIMEKRKEVYPLLQMLYENVYRVRSIGSGALSLAWVAQGFFGAFVNPYRPTKKFVDVYGGLIIAQEAGATVYKEKISDDQYKFLVGNEGIVKQLLQITNH